MTEPDTIDIVNKVVSLFDTEWNATNTSGEKPIIDKSDALGKGRDLGVYDYVEFSNTSPFSIDDADLTKTSEDFDAAVFVEIKSDDEARRKELFDEFRRIYKANDKRPDTPGGYDRMLIDEPVPLDDSTFGAWVLELTLAFEARSRTT